VYVCGMFSGAGAQNIFDLLAQFKRGECDGTKVRLGRLQVSCSSPLSCNLWSTSGAGRAVSRVCVCMTLSLDSNL